MFRRFLSTIMAVAICMAAGAQGICVINGNIADCTLADGKKIKKVSLVRTGTDGQQVEVASAKVKKGKYTLKYRLAQDEPVLMYTVGGFGEGTGIELFVEPGEVTVNTESAAKLCGSTVAGTPANDTYSAFRAIMQNGEKRIDEQVAELVAANGREWPESALGVDAVRRIESRECIDMTSKAIRFLIDNNASPMTPLVIERWLLNMLTPAYAEQMLKSISTTLYTHPYYHSLRNKVLATNMGVGNEVPDIILALSGGETKKMSDFRGKYVILNFWTTGCTKSEDMFAELQGICDIIKENDGKFVIISISLDSDTAAWRSVVERYNVENWLHACDGAGTGSQAAKLFGVEKTPRIVMIEPEGLAVSLDMDVDELAIRVDQIHSGDLYYLDQKK